MGLRALWVLLVAAPGLCLSTASVAQPAGEVAAPAAPTVPTAPAGAAVDGSGAAADDGAAAAPGGVGAQAGGEAPDAPGEAGVPPSAGQPAASSTALLGGAISPSPVTEGAGPGLTGELNAPGPAVPSQGPAGLPPAPVALPAPGGETPPGASLDPGPVFTAGSLDRRDPRIAPRIAVGDAHRDRVLLGSTAEVHPAGTFYGSSYDLLINQIGYAFTDDAQLTLTATPPIEEAQLVAFDLTLKQVIARPGPLRFAGMVSLSGVRGLESGPMMVARLGLVSQICFEPGCRSSASLGLGLTPLGLPLATQSLGVVWGISEHFSLLLELGDAFAMSPVVPQGSPRGQAVGAGCRFGYARWALDLAFTALVSAEDKAEPFVLPLLVASYRFDTACAFGARCQDSFD